MSNTTKETQLHEMITRNGEICLPVNIATERDLDDADLTVQFIDDFLEGSGGYATIWIPVDTSSLNTGAMIQKGIICPVKVEIDNIQFLYINELSWSGNGPSLEAKVMPSRNVSCHEREIYRGGESITKTELRFEESESRNYRSNSRDTDPDDTSHIIWLNDDNMAPLFALWRINPYLPSGKRFREVVSVRDLNSLLFPND